MKNHVLNCIVPAPVSVSFRDGHFALKNLRSIFAENGLERFAAEAAELCAAFGIPAVTGTDPDADLVIRRSAEPGKESWTLDVTPDAVTLEGGDDAGVFYGLQALTQIFAAAAIRGVHCAEIECGHVEDAPRFGWRGCMLDSARHCQSKETVKAVIRMAAAYRLNVFHWHLTDNQGWRIHTGSVPRSASQDSYTPGFFTKADLQEIAAYAKKNFVQIVPEIDIPGHSRSILNAFPQFACDSEHPGNEFCIGNPDAVEFLKKLFAELFEIFPDSKFIHFGGDEAELTHWEKCPRCQAAMKNGNFRNLRELENHFLTQLTRFALEKGRTPIVWGAGVLHPSDTIVQNWLDIREPFRHIANGNKVIMSIHSSYYLDYPANASEPAETWMFALPEEGVYLADPYVIWEKEWNDKILGPETCLWTEYVPEWRVFQKLLPRMGAFAEVAWSRPENKEWSDYKRRSECLRAAGYEDYLRTLR